MSEAAAPALAHNRRSRVRRGLVFCGLTVLLASLSFAVSLGAVAVPASTVWGILLNKLSPGMVEQTWSQGREAIVWEIRFRRAILAMMVGSWLALVGAASRQ